jgi:hypothetical protein
MVRTLALWIGSTLLAGCYNYEPLSRAHLIPSAYLAVTLSDAGSEDLARYLGPSVVIVRGRFLSATERGLAMSVETVEDRRGQTVGWQGETVVIPSDLVRTLEERRAARGKTVLFAGASLVGFLAAYAAFGPGTSGTSPGSGGPPPTPR